MSPLSLDSAVLIATTGGQKPGFTVALCAFLDGTIFFKERGSKLGDRVRIDIKCPDNVKVTTNG